MSLKKEAKKVAQIADRDPMKMLHKWGVRSKHAYMLGLVALSLSVLTSIFMSSDSRRARVGAVLAPTLIAIGIGLKAEE